MADSILTDSVLQALQKNYSGNQSLTPAVPAIDEQDPTTAAAVKYLTTPTDMSNIPTVQNIVPKDIANIQNAHGTIPAILSGIGGILDIANTSTGQKIISQLSGGDRFNKSAWLENAANQQQKEMGLQQGAMGMEAERQKNLGQAGIENIKAETEVAREKAALDQINQQFLNQANLQSQKDQDLAKLELNKLDVTQKNAVARWSIENPGKVLTADVIKFFGGGETPAPQPAQAPQKNNQLPSFKSDEEVQSAGLKSGDHFMLNGIEHVVK